MSFGGSGLTALVIWRLRLLFTAVERARRSSERREEYYRTILDNVADLILALDSSGRATYISPSVLEILALPAFAWVAPGN
jgi:PAS domain-containing protein